MFVEITGRWKVPAIELPSSIGDAKEGEIVCSSSTWIGLDGARSYLHSSLPQIGTIQQVVVKNGHPVPVYLAFREWWCAGHPSSPGELSLQVEAGDWVDCTLTVDSPTTATFRMTNLTAGSATGKITVDAPYSPARGTSLPRLQRLISGATAQWITERPSDPKTHNAVTGQSGRPYDLANFGTVVFENCGVVTAPDPASTIRNAGRTLADGSVSLRNMVRIHQNRAELMSRAEWRSPSSVATVYISP